MTQIESPLLNIPLFVASLYKSSHFSISLNIFKGQNIKIFNKSEDVKNINQTGSQNKMCAKCVLFEKLSNKHSKTILSKNNFFR